MPVCQYGAGAQLIRQEASDDSYSLESECVDLMVTQMMFEDGNEHRVHQIFEDEDEHNDSL